MSSNDPHIVDTVVLLYFLLVDRFDLLGALIGTPVQVPFSVHDPDDPRDSAGSAVRSDLTSEMRQAIRHYEANARSTHNRASLDRIARVDALHDEGRLVAVAMTDDERHLAAEVQSRDRTKTTRHPLSTRTRRSGVRRDRLHPGLDHRHRRRRRAGRDEDARVRYHVSVRAHSKAHHPSRSGKPPDER